MTRVPGLERDIGYGVASWEGTIRQDPEEWEQWVHEFAWLHEDVTRPAETMNGSVRNPFNHNDTELYRIYWLEMSVEKAVDKINELGQERFKDFRGVDGAHRQTFLCRYHLAWDNQCIALAFVRRKVRGELEGDRTLAPIPRDGGGMRRALICEQSELGGEDRLRRVGRERGERKRRKGACLCFILSLCI